jgi:hypothetical protein
MKFAIVVALNSEMMTIRERLLGNRLRSISLSGYAMDAFGFSQKNGQMIGIWKVNFVRQGQSVRQPLRQPM